MRISRKWIFLLILLALPSIAFSKPPDVTDFTDDIEVIQNTRKAMQDILAYVKSKPEIFPPQKTSDKRLTSREQRQVIWQTWQAFLDRLLVLDDIGQRYETLYRELDDREAKQNAFRVSYAAFLSQYRYALEFITLMENDPAMHTMLNEAVPELGLQAGRLQGNQVPLSKCHQGCRVCPSRCTVQLIW